MCSYPRAVYSKGKSDETSDAVIRGLHVFQKENTQAWENAIEAITQSTINHINQAKKIGTSGALVSIFNATSKFGTVAEYEKYSRPYDKRALDALADTKLTFLHLHFLDRPSTTGELTSRMSFAPLRKLRSLPDCATNIKQAWRTPITMRSLDSMLAYRARWPVITRARSVAWSSQAPAGAARLVFLKSLTRSSPGLCVFSRKEDGVPRRLRYLQCAASVRCDRGVANRVHDGNAIDLQQQ